MTPLLRNILFAVGAVALLTGVALGVVWLRSGSGSRAPAAAETGITVLVAAKPIPSGALLRAEDMSLRELPAAAKAPTGAFVGEAARTELIGAVATRDFAPGEVLTGGGLVRSSERGFLAATLSPGYRAVTIAIDTAQSASGLVLPGDRVDVILVQEFGEAAPRRRAVGETVLHGARVVAVGRAFNKAPEEDAKAKDAESASPRTLTLEVMPLDAERLYVANRLGKLELALRALAGGDRAGPEGEAGGQTPPPPIPVVWAGDVSAALGGAVGGASSASAPSAAPAPRPAAVRNASSAGSVVILRGSRTE
ncbi:Flp pilus assembly protein CpaB [Phenylobacterium sp.]|uniref:Flp pilus assembly protein CpaB n=1 Tax=Phenylobacterium sp. TaxID=1871053 RepID=UPI00391A9B7C